MGIGGVPLQSGARAGAALVASLRDARSPAFCRVPPRVDSFAQAAIAATTVMSLPGIKSTLVVERG